MGGVKAGHGTQVSLFLGHGGVVVTGWLLTIVRRDKQVVARRDDVSGVGNRNESSMCAAMLQVVENSPRVV
jgi:hypothetical protein